MHAVEILVGRSLEVTAEHRSETVAHEPHPRPLEQLLGPVPTAKDEVSPADCAAKQGVRVSGRHRGQGLQPELTGRRLEEADERAEEVQVPRLRHSALCERQDGPDNLETGQEVRRELGARLEHHHRDLADDIGRVCAREGVSAKWSGVSQKFGASSQ